MIQSINNLLSLWCRRCSGVTGALELILPGVGILKVTLSPCVSADREDKEQQV